MRVSMYSQDELVRCGVNDGLRWMSNDTPYPLAIQSIAILLLVRCELQIGERLHHEPSAEESHGQPVRVLWVHMQRRRLGTGRNGSEGEGEGEGDESLEGGFRQKHREERFVPESFLLLGGVVAGIVALSREASGRDAVEDLGTPGGHTGQEELLGVQEMRPGCAEGDVVVDDAGADGAPPGVGDLACGPHPVFPVDAVCGSRGGVDDHRYAGVEAQRWEDGRAKDPDGIGVDWVACVLDTEYVHVSKNHLQRAWGEMNQGEMSSETLRLCCWSCLAKLRDVSLSEHAGLEAEMGSVDVLFSSGAAIEGIDVGVRKRTWGSES